jgi:hypothetical protein
MDVNGVTMVLGSDKAFVRSGLEARLVLAAVPKFEFVSVCSGRQGQNLVTEAYAKDGRISLHGPSDMGDRRKAQLGVARAVGDHDPIKSLCEEVVIPGHPDHRDASSQQAPDNTGLAPAINDDNTLLSTRVKDGILHADQGHEVLSVGIVKRDILFTNEDLPQHAALLSQVLRERPGIDP